MLPESHLPQRCSPASHEMGVLFNTQSCSWEDFMSFPSVSPRPPCRCWWNERSVRVEEKSSSVAGLVQPPPEAARSRHSQPHHACGTDIWHRLAGSATASCKPGPCSRDTLQPRAGIHRSGGALPGRRHGGLFLPEAAWGAARGRRQRRRRLQQQQTPLAHRGQHPCRASGRKPLPAFPTLPCRLLRGTFHGALLKLQLVLEELEWQQWCRLLRVFRVAVPW